MNRLFKQSILAGGTFAGGIVAGFLIGSKRVDLQTFFDSGIVKSKKAFESAKRRKTQLSESGKNHLNAIRTDLAKSFKDPIPDLYKATESLTVDDLELKLPR